MQLTLEFGIRPDPPEDYSQHPSMKATASSPSWLRYLAEWEAAYERTGSCEAAYREAAASRMRTCSKCQLAQDANAMAYQGNDAWLCAVCCRRFPAGTGTGVRGRSGHNRADRARQNVETPAGNLGRARSDQEEAGMSE